MVFSTSDVIFGRIQFFEYNQQYSKDDNFSCAKMLVLRKINL